MIKYKTNCNCNLNEFHNWNNTDDVMMHHTVCLYRSINMKIWKIIAIYVGLLSFALVYSLYGPVV